MQSASVESIESNIPPELQEAERFERDVDILHKGYRRTPAGNRKEIEALINAYTTIKVGKTFHLEGSDYHTGFTVKSSTDGLTPEQDAVRHALVHFRKGRAGYKVENPDTEVLSDDFFRLYEDFLDTSESYMPNSRIRRVLREDDPLAYYERLGGSLIGEYHIANTDFLRAALIAAISRELRDSPLS